MIRRSTLLFGLLVAVTFGGSCGGNEERIVFLSVRPSDWNIYVMQPDGAKESQLTRSRAIDWSPALSPDGTRIAFSSNRRDSFDIYVMDADGSNVARLTDSLLEEGYPSWSPSARQIAFQAEEQGAEGTRRIYLMNADGSGMRRLTGNELHERAADWSPDGKRVIFAMLSGANIDIYVVQADGEG